MKKFVGYLLLFLSPVLALSAGNSEAGGKIPVTVNEYVELMEAVARLGGNSIYVQNYAPAYQKDIEEWFGPYREHPCIAIMPRMFSQYMISYNAIPMLGVNIEMVNGKFRTIGPKAASSRWSRNALKEFLPLLSDFYKVTDFHEFFEAHREVYSMATESFEKYIMSEFDLEWFYSFFGVGSSEKFSVILGLNNGLGNFGIQRSPKGEPDEHIAVMLYAADENNYPCYDRNVTVLVGTLVHEFCHSFIKADESMKPIGEKYLAENLEKLHSMGYGTWQEVIEETFVRAATIRYMIDHGYPEDVIQNEIDQQGEFYGMVWMPKDMDSYRGDIYRLFDTE